jgi:HK97 family phage portal protein
VAQLDWSERRGNLELPPSRIVRRPFSRATRREWVSYVVATLALYDVAYLLKVGGEDAEGVPVGLLPLDPTQVMPKTQGTSISPFLLGESYLVGSTEVPADRLVILRRSPTPGADEVTGGVIRLARTEFAAAIAASNYASRYWQAGGSPTTVLESDQQIPDAIASQMSDRWRERRSRGPDYAPVLSGGVKAREMGADVTNQAAVEARREQVADIGRYFGIPTAILNAPAGDSETYATTEAQGIHLVTYTLRNYIQAIEDAISDQLPGGRVMRMDTYQITKGTQLSQAQTLQLATGGKAWMTPDEARELLGLPPAEDPDELNPEPEAPEPVAVPMED